MLVKGATGLNVILVVYLTIFYGLCCQRFWSYHGVIFYFIYLMVGCVHIRAGYDFLIENHRVFLIHRTIVLFIWHDICLLTGRDYFLTRFVHRHGMSVVVWRYLLLSPYHRKQAPLLIDEPCSARSCPAGEYCNQMAHFNTRCRLL